VAYVAAVDTHQRLLQQQASSRRPSAQMERRVRLAANEVGRAAKMLSLNPYDRVRLDLPPPPKPVDDQDDAWASLRRFPVIDGGKGDRRR
jgi:hypothetical protein